MNFFRRTLICTIILVSCYVSVSANYSPSEQLRSSIERILDILSDQELRKVENKQQRREKITSVISQRFDFREMARRSLSVHWKKLSADEQKSFVSIFSQLLQQSYIGRIEKYSNEEILFQKEKIRGKHSEIHTLIQRSTIDIPIIYKMRLKGDEWWVYDLDIEGVSLIKTYMGQFDEIIRKKSYGSLYERMKKKLATIEAQEKTVSN